jgi:hypothetical protein
MRSVKRFHMKGRSIEPTNLINNKYQDNWTPGSNNHNMKVMTQDLSQGSCACRHASPRCVPLHHVVRWIIGHTPSLSKGATRTYQMARGCNDTSNLLTLSLALRRGRYKPFTITRGGQEQSPTLANASKLLQAV